MLRAQVTPERESNTRQRVSAKARAEFMTLNSQDAEMPPLAPCGHAISGQHYCDYIRVQHYLAALLPTETCAEQLVVSYLAASLLWWDLQQRDLAVISRHIQAGTPLLLEDYQDLEKRISRCGAISAMQVAAGQILRRHILYRPAALGFRSILDLSQVECYTLVAEGVALLKEAASRISLDAASCRSSNERRERLTSLLSLIYAFEDDFAQVEQDVAALTAHLVSRPDTRTVSAEALLPVQMLSLADESIARYHPSAVAHPDQTDVWAFIYAHVLCELICFAPLRAAAHAAKALFRARPGGFEASLERLFGLSQQLARLYGVVIESPLTIGPADYIFNVRGDLHGSGGESVAFHAFQIEVGYRNPAYYRALAALNVLTPELETLWKETSLNDELMRLCVDQGIFRASQSPGWQARKLARIMQRTGNRSPHAGLHALCRQALAFDRKWRKAKHHHWEMVLAMIGDKPSVGAGGKHNHQMRKLDPRARPVGGRRYLRLTLNETFFPILRRALCYLKENWRDGVPASPHAQERSFHP
jgi:tryptophan 2,3-dioxygenase